MISEIKRSTLGTNIIPYQGIFEDDFPFPKVGYVSLIEGTFNPKLFSWVSGLLV